MPEENFVAAPPATRHVFAYGSLMYPAVWSRVVRGQYRSQPATVKGFRRVCVDGHEHPALVALRACADLSTGGALAGLLDQTRRAAIDHGAGHPAVQARIDVLLEPGAARSDAGSRAAIEQLALQSARAVPLGNRWRARTIAAVLVESGQPVEFDQPLIVIE